MSSVMDLTKELPADMDLTTEVFLSSPTIQQAEQPMIQIYLRLRPFSKEELDNNEDQDCVIIDDSQTVTLTAPKGSANMKSSERGVGMSLHRFSFSKVSPTIQQA
ncbi:kinesin-like protein KIF20A, partial [Austrofundulus limnaeus]|uniref:Kinesin-like protein KIF20A n=1 Tax=Austrofundulus limnaeus TaxID=52670 RepID=A0A2I4ALJ2_AUSLI